MTIFKQADQQPQKPQQPAEKRDITIRSEPKYQPDHVVAETDEARWKILLNKDERYDLAEAYEQKALSEDEEVRMLDSFMNSIYANTAVTLSIKLSPRAPGMVFLEAESQYAGESAAFVPYSEVGKTICRWIEKHQIRKDLVADLVATIKDADDTGTGGTSRE